MRFENGVEAIFSGRDEKPFVEWDIMGSRGRIRIGNNVLDLLKMRAEAGVPSWPPSSSPNATRPGPRASR